MWLTWSLIWPRFVTTPYEFGRHWANMTRGFLEGYARVGAVLIRYEDLDELTAVKRLEAYLGWPIPRSSEMRRIRTSGQALPIGQTTGKFREKRYRRPNAFFSISRPGKFWRKRGTRITQRADTVATTHRVIQLYPQSISSIGSTRRGRR